MRKLWLCLFYALCVFTIVFSLFWMALPRLTAGPRRLRGGAPSPPCPASRCRPCRKPAPPPDYLCDEGGAGRGLAV